MNPARIQAGQIRLGFDDRSSLEFDLTDIATVGAIDDGEYRLFRLPVNRTSVYVNVYVTTLVNPDASYMEWRKIGVYVDQAVSRAVTSAAHVESTRVAIDFSQPDGSLPTVFGTDEVYKHKDGYEDGWQVSSWPHTKTIFNLYRLQMGDYWPRAYGADQYQIGELAHDIGPDTNEIVLTNLGQYLPYIANGSRLRIGYEQMKYLWVHENVVTVKDRGMDSTQSAVHRAGSPVYAYKDVGQILRLQEILPEFKVVRFVNGYKSGLSPISWSLSYTDPARLTVASDVRTVGTDFVAGDMIRIGREMFRVLEVVDDQGEQILTLKRGQDGTNEKYIQHNSPTRDVYKILEYEPYYEGFKNDPTNPDNYKWEQFDRTLDKVIVDGDAIPWIIVWSTRYATEPRGRISAIEDLPPQTTGYAGNNRNCVIVDEYNDQHDTADWWYYSNPANDINDDTRIRGNMYQNRYARLHILTGQAAGKVFYVRSNTSDRLRIVQAYEDSTFDNETPAYVDLAAEGVAPGDTYVLRRKTYGSVAPKYWQYNADIFHNVGRHILEKYGDKLNGRPIYMEYYLEPNLATYGTWCLDAYIASYNVFAETIRAGGPHFAQGFDKSQVVIGAGAIAGGLTGPAIHGSRGEYDFALALVDRADPLDFVSHHRYYTGSRVQKRANSWEYWMMRSYAQAIGKGIEIMDSEDSVATAAAAGSEEARHWAEFSVPYWPANFMNSYCGEYGELGRLGFISHFRLYSTSQEGFGMVALGEDGGPVYDLVYWPIKMFQRHTSMNRHAPDTIARLVKKGDQYGWVQAMGTIHGETGVKKVHLVNKKKTPVTVSLELLGVEEKTAWMESIVGFGPNQTIEDGFHPIDYRGVGGRGVSRAQGLTDLAAVVLEPCSANIVTLGEDAPPPPPTPVRRPRPPSDLRVHDGP